MNKKVFLMLGIILFIAVLILLNTFLKFENNKMLSNNQKREENSMDILKVTSANFDTEVLQSDKPVLIDFYADWCGPCKMLSPIVDEVAEEDDSVKVVKINIDDEQSLAMKYQVMSIPTLVVIKNGQEVQRSVGLVDKSRIEDMIK